MDLQHYREQMLEVEEAIKGILPSFQYTLMTMTGIDIGTASHPVFREYFQNKQQALICISRRLVNIVYGMLKNHTEYREAERGTADETV